MKEEHVWVRRQWSDYRRAKYGLADVQKIHWSDTSGGVNAVSPHFFLHGYVPCDGMLEGELAHSGTHGPCPHDIKVCITKSDNDQGLFSKIAEIAGTQPKKLVKKTYEIVHRDKVIWTGIAFSDQSARRRARKNLGIKSMPRGHKVRNSPLEE